MEYKKDDAKQVIIRVSNVSLVWNILLASVKLVAGVIANSHAMISDAIHSGSDVLGTGLVILGAHLSGKKADKEHPYGHERMECVIALLLANILVLAGIAIGYAGIKTVLSIRAEATVAAPGTLALAAAVVSILVKEGMYWYTIIAARKINSVSLKAEAWHHRSDAFSSVGSLIGIAGARMGFAVLDPIASIVICIFIIKIAVDIFLETVDKMVDKSCDDSIIQNMEQEIKNVQGVIDIDDIKTRQFGAKMYVDVEIQVDGELSLKNAHTIAEDVHATIERSDENIKHCMVHVNPSLN
ncbi:cation transporter [Anaerotruncus sp. 80]|uniref:Cation transporter n=1 Tax=Anaerotruncus colihominis TaxID=169435 RepID=A0A845QPF5_9FIRM|nr:MULTISPECIES: cation diffusion facilitator family transporter [Anaerotruncus]NBH62593.1 cation transporter [Anaerotruncus colihominis]NCF03248.1 cation transporter [Anaerotruncus sp. 80]